MLINRERDENNVVPSAMDTTLSSVLLPICLCMFIAPSLIREAPPFSIVANTWPKLARGPPSTWTQSFVLGCSHDGGAGSSLWTLGDCSLCFRDLTSCKDQVNLKKMETILLKTQEALLQHVGRTEESRAQTWKLARFLPAFLTSWIFQLREPKHFYFF